jgi:hypothetical protein
MGVTACVLSYLERCIFSNFHFKAPIEEVLGAAVQIEDSSHLASENGKFGIS